MRRSLIIILITLSIFNISTSQDSKKYLVKIDFIGKTDKRDISGDILLERDDYVIIQTESLTDVLQFGSSYEILNATSKDVHYILIFDPGNLGDEALKQYGDIICELPESDEYIMKSYVSCSGELAKMGYSAYELKPLIKVNQQYDIEKPEYSDIIKTATERLSSNASGKILDFLENIPTRYSFAPEIENARLFIENLCEGWGYEVSIQDYIFNIVESDYIQGIYFLPDRTRGWIPTRSGFVFHTDDLCYNFDYTHSQMRNTNAYFLDENTGWLSGLCGLVGITTDGGDNWTVVDTNHPDISIWDIEFVDENTGFACGQNGLFMKTTDGGYSWSEIPLGTGVSLEEMDFIDDQICYLSGYDSTLFKTTDGWSSWEEITIPVSTDLLDIEFLNENEGWCCGVRDGYIIHTTDGGITWEEQDNHSESMMNLDFWNSEIGWAVSWDGTALHTTDGGETWEVQETGTTNPFYSIVSLDENSAIAGGFGCLYLTRNGGDTWEPSDFSGAGKFTWENVIASSEGVSRPDEIVIAVAHYDSISDDPWNRAPGANDNGTGTTALLTMAEATKDISTERSFIFLFVSGEEEGLWGSRAYAQWARENDLNIIGVLNMDMIGYLDEPIWDLDLRDNEPSEWLCDYTGEINDLYNLGLTIYPHQQGSGGSDHIPFWEVGYPAICSIEHPGDHWYPYYHTTEDLMKYLNMDFQTEVTRLNLATLLSLAEVRGITDHQKTLEPFAYPNPYKPSMNVQGITFANLLEFNILKIYTLSGRMIHEKNLNDDTSYMWNCIGEQGKEVSSGVYLYVLEGDENFSGKIAIIR